ncbi:RDD family protein [Catellatospora paridis]|uniref:RDD family protein n=1 Tax=Catellatospora paridis TaxID=1617086 RepID=UPI0012D41D5E|nr:RDD family protein [Catellatospora paridis]
MVSRIAGLAIDAGLLAVASSFAVSGVPAVWSALAGEPPGWLKAASAVVAAVLPVVYFTGCWWMTGQTLGALLFGTVVRRTDGRHVGFCRALLRALIGLAIPVLWLVGMVGVLTDDRRRAWHDRLFGTVVRYAERGP